MLKNFAILMFMDLSLSLLICYKKARKKFILPKTFTTENVKKKISKFGKNYEPIKKYPLPEMLRYQSKPPLTVYSQGIEKIFVAYHEEFLDKEIYLSVLSSARANIKYLKGKKKHLFLDKEQKKSPINQTAAVIIFANKVSDELQNNLYKTVSNNNCDDYDTSILPCIVDLENKICTFDSLLLPNIGQYPAKNRCIKMIKKYVFGGRFPYKSSPDMLSGVADDYDLNQSLWEFWKKTKKEAKVEISRNKKLFKKMKNGEIIFDDGGYIYVKWKEKGIWLSAELNEEDNIVEIDPVKLWDYPKTNNISKADISSLKSIINTFFAEKGYLTKYISLDD